MDRDALLEFFEQLAGGQVDPAEALRRFGRTPFVESLGFARLDHHRAARKGLAEVVFAQGKTLEQLAPILEHMAGAHQRVLATRVAPDIAAALVAALPRYVHHPAARALTRGHSAPQGDAPVVVVCAGTSDLPVAEEAALTAEMLGAPVERVADVGVAGLHRLLEVTPLLQRAAVVVAVAGMEGALPSVIGGLVDAPVIAVPTSVGYGASFAGVAALLAMLNSCAPGVSVVNIDNGFGAGYSAALIRKRIEP